MNADVKDGGITDIGKPDRPNLESALSGIHWAAVLGGAAAAAGISMILVPLGSALGLASFSVYTADMQDAAKIGVGVAVWLVIMQWLASGVGGYIAGRLRVKWADLNSDEVFFRDTAHGFLSWAVATLFIVLIYVLSMGSVLKAASSVADAATSDDRMGYVSETLYRGATTPSADASVEAARILATGLGEGTVTAADRAYLARQVAARTGLAPAEAQARVNTALADVETTKRQAVKAAEDARKAMSALHFALALSLLVGAFIASVSGAIGGRLRDTY